MPSETIYFPDSIHRKVMDKVEQTDENTSQVVQTLVLKGLKAEDKLDQ